MSFTFQFRHNRLAPLMSAFCFRLCCRCTGAELHCKNVHGDVVAFVALGLIERDGAGHLLAPYDELVIRAPLRLAA